MMTCSQTTQFIESQNAGGVCLYNDWIVGAGAAKCRSGNISKVIDKED